MSILQIIKAAQAAVGSLNKRRVLEAHRDDKFLQDYLKHVYDPSINYYQTKIDKTATQHWEPFEFDAHNLRVLKVTLADRHVTGNEAVEWLADMYAHLTDEGKELLQMLINRSVGGGVGIGLVTKVWSNLIEVTPYMRCVGLSDKAKKYLDSQDTVKIVQKKADGTFCYMINVTTHNPTNAELITRGGLKYPTWLSYRLDGWLFKKSDKFSRSGVFVGELLVYKDNKLLPRSVGNGVYNAIMKGSPEGLYSDYTFAMEAWDFLLYQEYADKLSTRPYEERLTHLEEMIGEVENCPVSVIETYRHTDWKDVFDTNNYFLRLGYEGSVVKSPSGQWFNGTSKDCMKLKVVFEAEYYVREVVEGTGKYVGMMGALVVESADGEILSSVGTGFSDGDRKYWWDKRGVVYSGSFPVVTVKANDILTARDAKVKSLFLPVYVEERCDKEHADSTARCFEQLESAKSGESV